MVATAIAGVSWGEFVVFRAVVVEHESVEDVARAMQMPVKDVCQMVDRVQAAMVAAAAVESKEERDRRIYISEQIAAERINHLHGEAIRCFHASQGEQLVVREIGEGEAKRTLTSKRVSPGDTRYLKVAATLAMMGGRLPVPVLQSIVLAEPPSPKSPKNHPDGDCSERASEQPVTAEAAAIFGDVSHYFSGGNDSKRDVDSERNFVRSSPVQSPTAGKRPPR